MPVDRTPSARKGVWLAIAVAIGWLMISSWAGPLAGQLSQVQENDNAAFLPSSAESTLVAEEQAQRADSTAIPLLVVVSKPDGGQLTAADQQAVGELIQQIRNLQVPDGEQVSAYLDPVPLIPIPSEDGDAVLINILEKMRTPGGAKLTSAEWNNLQATEVSDASELAGTDGSSKL